MTKMGVAAAIGLATLLTTAIHGTAGAEDLRPIKAFSVALNDVSGVVYYTVEKDGLRLVATLGGEGARPVRFVTTLAPRQSMTLAVPESSGTPASEIVFSRSADDRISVTRSALVATN